MSFSSSFAYYNLNILLKIIITGNHYPPEEPEPIVLEFYFMFQITQVVIALILFLKIFLQT